MKHWIKAFSLVELFEGLFLTLRIMFRAKPTVRYPEERTPYSPRFRGMHALMKTSDGAERCIGCKLCEAACPSQAITIVSGANADGKRCAVSYEIDQGKCIFCGICEEACPVDAIVHTKQFEYSAVLKEKAPCYFCMGPFLFSLVVRPKSYQSYGMPV